MNSIRNIEIKNFKSIRHQKIEDCKRINVFIGYPNTGKSNLLEALSLFSIDKPDADFSSFVRIEQLTTLFFDGNIDNQIEIRINGDNRMLAMIDSDQLSFHWQLAGEGASFDKMGPGMQQKIYGLLNFSKLSDKDKISNWDSIFKRQPRSADFIQELGPGYLSNIKKYIFQKGVSYSSGKYDSLSVPYGNNLFDIILTNREISSEARQLFEEYKLELLYNSASKEISILKRINSDVIFTIPYSLVSDTLLRLIFYMAAIASNKDTIFLFEEPEAHMFPPYMRKFTTDMVFDKTSQFFMATHSPYILDFLMEEAPEDLSIYLVYYENGESKVKRMSERDMDEVNEYGVDLFYNLESYLKNGQVNNA
jgi:predicted ATP-dependent endonuclease of OLD family